ncbi:MAG: hypothetical protein ACLUP8_04560 [Ruminococcus sp.]|uniref:hypothetical protein n=1 Tax=Ruminococcus sp. TaxID=41978 RepID=UPI003996AE1E
MKYKVGDKVRVRRDLKASGHYGGVLVNSEMAKKEIVTIASVGVLYYKIEEDSFCWTEKMFEGLVDDELTAEEAIKIQAEMCKSTTCADCEIDKIRRASHFECAEFRSKNPERVVEILKQWKKDHEKKPIETEYVWYVQIVEADTHILKHEEPLESVPGDDTIAKILKKWCSEHDGKYYAISERRCVVKE